MELCTVRIVILTFSKAIEKDEATIPELQLISWDQARLLMCQCNWAPPMFPCNNAQGVDSKPLKSSLQKSSLSPKKSLSILHASSFMAEMEPCLLFCKPGAQFFQSSPSCCLRRKGEGRNTVVPYNTRIYAWRQPRAIGTELALPRTPWALATELSAGSLIAPKRPSTKAVEAGFFSMQLSCKLIFGWAEENEKSRI